MTEPAAVGAVMFAVKVFPAAGPPVVRLAPAREMLNPLLPVPAVVMAIATVKVAPGARVALLGVAVTDPPSGVTADAGHAQAGCSLCGRLPDGCHQKRNYRAGCEHRDLWQAHFFEMERFQGSSVWESPASFSRSRESPHNYSLAKS